MMVPSSLSAEWEVFKILYVVWLSLVWPSPQSSLSEWTSVLMTHYTTMGLDTTKWVNARGCQKLAGFSMRIANPGSPFYRPTDHFVRSRKRGMWQKCTPPWGVGRWMHVSGGHLSSTPHVNLTLSCHHDRVLGTELFVILQNNRSAATFVFVAPC